MGAAVRAVVATAVLGVCGVLGGTLLPKRGAPKKRDLLTQSYHKTDYSRSSGGANSRSLRTAGPRQGGNSRSLRTQFEPLAEEARAAVANLHQPPADFNIRDSATIKVRVMFCVDI